MSKICLTCKKEVDDATNFCQYCGSTQFIPAKPSSNSSAPIATELTTPIEDTPTAAPEQVPFEVRGNANQAPAAPYAQAYEPVAQPVQPQINQAVPQAFPQNGPQFQANPNSVFADPVPAKKKHTGVIIGVVIGVIAVLLFVVLILPKLLSTNNNSSDDTYEPDYSTPIITMSPDVSGADYSKGTYAGNSYINEWANIKIEMPYGMSKASDEQINNMASSMAGADIGFYFVNSDITKQIYSAFIPMSFYENEDSVSDYIKEEFGDGFKKEIEKQGYAAETDISDDYSTVIGGEDYTAIDLDITLSMGSTIVDEYMTIAYRKVGSYLIAIYAVSTPNDEISDLLDLIEPYNS